MTNKPADSNLIQLREVPEFEGEFNSPQLPPLPKRKCLPTGNKFVNLYVEGWDHIINDTDISKSDIIMKYTWKNKNRMKVQVVTYGATITNIYIPDRKGKVEDVLLGFDNLEGYLQPRNPYFGATIGRVTDFTDKATFELDDETINISPNKGKHHFHGGFKGFDKALWEAHNEGTQVIMTHISRAGHEGYPGALFVRIIFDVSPTSKLSIDFSARCDHPTIINMSTQFPVNLAGHGAGAAELYKHLVQLNCHKYLKMNEDNIPTGGFKCVGGSYYDFRVPRSLGSGLRKIMNGYEETMVITRDKLKQLNFVAKVMHPCSGRVLEVYSDQPAVFFGTNNELPDPDFLAIPRDIYDRTMVYAILKMKDKCYNVPDSNIMLEPSPFERLRGGASKSDLPSNNSSKSNLGSKKIFSNKNVVNTNIKTREKQIQICAAKRSDGFISIIEPREMKPIMNQLYDDEYILNEIAPASEIGKGQCCGGNHKLVISKTVQDILANMSDEKNLAERPSSLHTRSFRSLKTSAERLFKIGSASVTSKSGCLENLIEGSKERLRGGQSEYYLNTPCTELCTCKLTDSQKQGLYNSMFGPGPMTFGVGVDADMSERRIECILGKARKRYCRHAGFVLRTEKFPDAVHHDHFPCIMLRPGETYHQRTTYKFGLQFNPDEFFVPPKCDSDSLSMFSF